ncbi:MAG TPA: glycine C-acetyltransferase [Bacteroidales bacterium]|jgi:glycine C-acetyltransferase|nr:glycine C-acetyltransferase [Bacteroidales bacterium]HON20934.1 glycine C-acetyltransferase [Bacteroidales bacterium]HOR81613.1 glycine C-acetyltransferase [Bacteroidales bacterium]HPJ90311.1 glycine C-acetyltransferase [Bacteroidales bacterium]HQB19476.1 glycine C-acetyltransferase [Bacteroidales bacterium]
MYKEFQKHLKNQIEDIKAAGTYKSERILVSPQYSKIKVNTGKEVLNFCANNYLGLANSSQLVDAAIKTLKERAYGMASVRFICGTSDLHKKLEEKIANFFGTEDAILYASCFDANTGLFETILTDEDAILSDSLNHASIIDGVRLCKAQRFRYKNADMADLEKQLQDAQKCRFRLIATDGVFSMDGNVAPLTEIIKLAEKYGAMIMVDESHSAGVVGKTGRGVTELYNCRGKVEIITGTLGKAFGGAIGGFTTGKKEIIEILRQRSRPYLFSNSIPPMVAAAGVRMFEMMDETNELQDKLHANTEYFIAKMKAAGFDIKDTQSAICAVMLYDAALAGQFADKLLEEGVYVIGFSFPVVPKDQARIRVQLSAVHEKEHLDKAVNAFIKIGKELKVIK